MRNRLIAFVACALMVGLLSSAWAMSPETRRRVQEVRKAAEGHKSFLMEIEPPPPEAVGQNAAHGTILWAAPHSHRVESLEPVAGHGQTQRISVCDGNTIWSYFPSLKVAYKIDLKVLREKFSDEELVRNGVLFSSDPFQGANEERIKFLKQEPLDETPCYIFEIGSPKLTGRLLSVHAIVVWVGIKDGLLRRLETYPERGERLDRTTMKIRDVDLETSPQMFELKLPADCRVEDVTAKALESLTIKK